MEMHTKSKHAKLFACHQIACRVVLFKFHPDTGARCPSCSEVGTLVRYPVSDRLGVRS